MWWKKGKICWHFVKVEKTEMIWSIHSIFSNLHFTLSKKSCFKLGVRNRADHKPNWKNTKIQKLCQTYLKIRCRCAKFTQTRIAKYRWGIQQIKNISVNSKCWTYENWDKVQKESVIEKLKGKKSKIVNFASNSHLLYHWKKHW